MKKYLLLSAFIALNNFGATQVGTVALLDTLNNGKSTKIEVSPGEAFQVSLGFNAGTQFSWSVGTFDITKVQLVSTADVPTSCNSCSVSGGAFNRVFTFKALKKGSVILNFNFAAGTQPPTQTTQVKVKIEKDCPSSCCLF